MRLGHRCRSGIVGMGYVGSPLALLFSERRFRVTGFDVDDRKVETLNRGGSYILRIPENEIQSARKCGFEATSAYEQIHEMDVLRQSRSRPSLRSQFDE